MVMWEVFTKGMTPYAGQTPDEIAADVRMVLYTMVWNGIACIDGCY